MNLHFARQGVDLCTGADRRALGPAELLAELHAQRLAYVHAYVFAVEHAERRAVSAAQHDVSVGGPVVAPDVRTNGPAELLAELRAQCASDDVRAHVGAIEFSQRRADGRADCRAFVLAVGRPVGPSDRRPDARAERCALERAERRAVSAA